MPRGPASRELVSPPGRGLPGLGLPSLGSPGLGSPGLGSPGLGPVAFGPVPRAPPGPAKQASSAKRIFLSCVRPDMSRSRYALIAAAYALVIAYAGTIIGPIGLHFVPPTRTSR